MARIIKINDEYYVEYFGNGLRFQKKAGSTKKDAEQLLEKITESLKKEGTDIFTVNIKDWAEFMDEYLKVTSHKFTVKSKERLNASLHHFNCFLHDHYPTIKNMPDITPKVIEAYKAHLIASIVTGEKRKNNRLINFTIFCLREVLDFSVARGYLNDNPTLHVKMQKYENDGLCKVFSDDERLAFLEASDENFQFVFELMLFTGLKVQEVINLRKEHIDLKTRMIVLNREIPLEINIFEKLSQNIGDLQNKQLIFRDKNNQPHSQAIIYSEFHKVCARLNRNQHLHFCCLRDSFAAFLLKRGVNLFGLQKLMGLKDIAATMRYAHLLG